jgi:signal peptidase II
MRLLIRFALGALLIDQATKYLVVFWMGLDRVRAIDVWPPFLNFRYGENRGINFGLFTGETDWVRWVLIGFSLLVAGTVLYWVLRWHKDSWRMMISAGLLIGGALGNVADRLLYGYVLDFLNMSCCGLNNPFVFNVADVFIFAGVAGLVLFETGRGKKR